MDEASQGRLRGSDPVAVIDIGSNTIRLVVYEGLFRSPTPLFQEKIMGSLGAYLASTGKLNAETMPAVIEALARFRKLSDICGVAPSNLHPFATAAVRWAEDGPQFIEKAEKACGVPIEIIENAEEANLAATGVLAGFTSPYGVVGDLGGGSLELISVENGKFANAVSLPLGGLALIDRTKGDRTNAKAIIEAALEPMTWMSAYAGANFYAVGGTWRTLAKLDMRASAYPLSAVHGYTLDIQRIRKITGKYGNTPVSVLRGMDGMSAGREKTLPFGALLLNALVQKMEPSAVVFSAYGVREGYLYNLMGDAERARDPLLSACADVARLRSRSFAHGKELAAWTDVLFQNIVPDETIDERRLRHAACLLSDIAWRAHPDYRGEQSAALVAQSALVGLDHSGRAFLSLCVYYRYEKQLIGELLPKLLTLLSRRQARHALLIGQTVRLAHTLSAGMEGVLMQTSLKVEAQTLKLELPTRLRALNGKTLERRLKSLAKDLGVSFAIAIVPDPPSPRSSLLRSFIKRKADDVL